MSALSTEGLASGKSRFTYSTICDSGASSVTTPISAFWQLSFLAASQLYIIRHRNVTLSASLFYLPGLTATD